MANFRDGNLDRGQPLGMTVQQISLVADNTRIDPSNTSLVQLTSDNTTAANRTIVINQSTLVGHELHLVLVSSGATACELANSGTCKLAAAWTPASQYQAITLVSDGTYWVEKCRSNLTSSGVVPAYVVVYAGTYTTVGGSATEAQTVTGVASTDLVLSSLKVKGAVARTILTTAATANTITYVFSGDPSTDHQVTYQVLRAV